MKLLPLATALWATITTTAAFGHHDGSDRPVITIRPSANDTDDISAEFLQGIKDANHGGRLLLKEGETYIIGKKLELTFLDDVEVQLDGEIKVRH